MRWCFVLVVMLVVVAVAMAVDPQTEKLFQEVSKTKRSQDVWAVLAAGSRGWSNFRHQADLLHLYQVLHKNGVPDDHIITMFYDDIATDPNNPTPGIVVNKPNGTDVYAGVPKDYVGAAVTGDNFLKVITGEPTNAGTGRVLKSGPNSHVLVYFDDHGNRDIIGFPGGTLNAAQLNKANWVMFQKQMYGTLVQYISACYSGSMFYSMELPPNTYVATAAPVLASGFATGFDDFRQVYTASAFPLAMIESMERSSFDMTFQQHFEYINSQLGNFSLPCQFGDMTIAQSSMAQFFQVSSHKSTKTLAAADRDVMKGAVPQSDVPYEMAKRKAAAHPTAENLAELARETGIRHRIDRMGLKIRRALTPLEADDQAPQQSIPPCGNNCNSGCTCMQACDWGAELCKFECCDSRACFYDHVPAGAKESAHTKKMRAAHECADTLVDTLYKACPPHDYFGSLQATITRLCRIKNPSADLIAAARQVIHEDCYHLSALL